MHKYVLSNKTFLFLVALITLLNFTGLFNEILEPDGTLYALLAKQMVIWMFRKTHVDIEGKNLSIHKFSYKKKWHFLAVLILGWFMYGFFTLKPLNFFRAFNLNDEFKSNLALNPLQNFFTTLRFRKPDYNTKAKENFSTIANFLAIEKSNEANPYSRIVYPGTVANTPLAVPNVGEKHLLKKIPCLHK